MDEKNVSLVEAVRLAKESERSSAEFYRDSIDKTSDPLAQLLLQQLADFEIHHFDRLAALEQSLQTSGDYIVYTGRDLSLPLPGERPVGTGKTAAESDRLSLMQIVSVAIDLERSSQKRYEELAREVAHPVGRAMFERLAAEEHGHFQVLNKAYWGLNDTGRWILPG